MTQIKKRCIQYTKRGKLRLRAWNFADYFLYLQNISVAQRHSVTIDIFTRLAETLTATPLPSRLYKLARRGLLSGRAFSIKARYYNYLAI